MEGDSFGNSGGAGQMSWGDRVWKTIPSIYREQDTTNGGWLKLFIDAMTDSFMALREHASALATLRHPLSVRAGEAVSFTIDQAVEVSAEESEDGIAYLELHTSDSLLTISPGDVVRGGFRTVIRSVNAIGGYFTISGLENPVQSGALTIASPSMLHALAYDLNVHLEEHETITYQRAAVERSRWLSEARGSRKAIVRRAGMSGMTATVHQLYRISRWFYERLPADHVFLVDGHYYTDIIPEFARMDVVRADTIPADAMPPVTYTEEITVLTVAGTSPRWTLTLADPPVALIGTDGAFWHVTHEDGGDPFYVDSYDGDVTLQVTSGTRTPADGTYLLGIVPGICVMRNWRPSHRIRVDIEIRDDALIGQSSFYEDLIPRTIAQIKRQLPAHVKLAQVSFVMKASTSVSVASTIEGWIRTYGRFDVIAADVQPADTYAEEEI